MQKICTKLLIFICVQSTLGFVYNHQANQNQHRGILIYPPGTRRPKNPRLNRLKHMLLAMTEMADIDACNNRLKLLIIPQISFAYSNHTKSLPTNFNKDTAVINTRRNTFTISL